MSAMSMKAEPNIVNRKNFSAAHVRSPWPHCPIRKYIGTSTISKNTKNRNRSSARNTPMQPASSTSSHA